MGSRQGLQGALLCLIQLCLQFPSSCQLEWSVWARALAIMGELSVGEFSSLSVISSLFFSPWSSPVKLKSTFHTGTHKYLCKESLCLTIVHFRIKQFWIKVRKGNWPLNSPRSHHLKYIFSSQICTTLST